MLHVPKIIADTEATLAALAGAVDTAPAAGALRHLDPDGAPHQTIGALITLDARLQAFGRRAARLADQAGVTPPIVLARSARATADAISRGVHDAVRVFGSFAHSPGQADDIDIVLPPVDDDVIEALAELSTGGATDMRWTVPHGRIQTAGLPTIALGGARAIARAGERPVDVFFGTNAFTDFVMGARLDVVRDVWTITDRWCPRDDFFAGQSLVKTSILIDTAKHHKRARAGASAS